MSEGHTERLEGAFDGKYRIERKLGEGAPGLDCWGEGVVDQRLRAGWRSRLVRNRWYVVYWFLGVLFVTAFGDLFFA